MTPKYREETANILQQRAAGLETGTDSDSIIADVLHDAARKLLETKYANDDDKAFKPFKIDNIHKFDRIGMTTVGAVAFINGEFHYMEKEA